MSKTTPSVWSRWTWRKRAPELHEGQPIWRYWIEQFAVMVMCSERLKAHNRDDQQTVRRISAVLEGGTQWEREERRRRDMIETQRRMGDMFKGLVAAGNRMAEVLDTPLRSSGLPEFSSSSRFHSHIARERRKGLAFVHSEVNRVRKEMGLPPAYPWIMT